MGFTLVKYFHKSFQEFLGFTTTKLLCHFIVNAYQPPYIPIWMNSAFIDWGSVHLFIFLATARLEFPPQDLSMLCVASRKLQIRQSYTFKGSRYSLKEFQRVSAQCMFVYRQAVRNTWICCGVKYRRALQNTRRSSCCKMLK